MSVFIDTNIALYAISDDPVRGPMARQILAQPFEISAQILNEFANVSRRKLGKNLDEIEQSLNFIRASAATVHPVTDHTNQVGIRLARRYNLSTYDAILIAASLIANCNTLFSEDMQHGLTIEGRVTIHNPFS